MNGTCVTAAPGGVGVPAGAFDVTRLPRIRLPSRLAPRTMLGPSGASGTTPATSVQRTAVMVRGSSPTAVPITAAPSALTNKGGVQMKK